MNILYLGSFPPNFLVKRSGGRIDSLYRDAEPLIKGLRSISGVNLSVITSPDVASWPRGPLFIKRELNLNEGVTVVSSLNISFIKQFWTILSMTIEASRHINKSNGRVSVLIPYIVFRHVFTLRFLHFLYPHKVVQYCVVPDIFFPRKRLFYFFNRWSERMAKRFDGFFLYTEKMAEHLRINPERYIVIEGYRDVPDRKPIDSDVFHVVYAGSLNLNYGLGRLVEAMSLIDDPEVHLDLYGGGSAEAFVIEMAKQDSRIQYHGRVSNAEATDAIYSASALINPRNSHDGQYTEYSFPSKDIEYMATGVPTLLCKLPGMPKEYWGHFIDIGEGTPKEIAEGIVNVKSMSVDNRNRIGEDSRRFILERMDCSKQATRIVNLIKSIS